MTGFASRLGVIVKAKGNQVLNHMEDPNQILDLSYEEMVEQVAKAKGGLVTLTAAKRGVQSQVATIQQQSEKLDGQARVAIQAGREDLAREALSRKAGLDTQLQSLNANVESLEVQQQKLEENIKTLQQRIDSFRTQKEVMKANYTAAQAQVSVGEAATAIGEHAGDVGLAMQRATEKIEGMQARAGALDELVQSGALDDMSLGGGETALDKQLNALTQGHQVDDELAKLKAELGPAPAVPALGAGS